MLKSEEKTLMVKLQLANNIKNNMLKLLYVGTEFSRITYYNTRTTQFTVPTLTVEVGLGSQLLVIPNQFSKLFFEVTNNRAQTVFVRFRCHDDKSFLVRMDPIRYLLKFSKFL